MNIPRQQIVELRDRLKARHERIKVSAEWPYLRRLGALNEMTAAIHMVDTILEDAAKPPELDCTRCLKEKNGTPGCTHCNKETRE